MKPLRAQKAGAVSFASGSHGKGRAGDVEAIAALGVEADRVFGQLAQALELGLGRAACLHARRPARRPTADQAGPARDGAGGGLADLVVLERVLPAALAAVAVPRPPPPVASAAGWRPLPPSPSRRWPPRPSARSACARCARPPSRDRKRRRCSPPRRLSRVAVTLATTAPRPTTGSSRSTIRRSREPSMSRCSEASLAPSPRSPASTVPRPSTTVTESGARPATAADTRWRTPASSRSSTVRPGCRFNTTAAAAPCAPRCGTGPSPGSVMCTRADRTDASRQMVRASSPSMARRRFTRWVNSETPRSPRSKISKPTPPPRGSPDAASIRRTSCTAIRRHRQRAAPGLGCERGCSPP